MTEMKIDEGYTFSYIFIALVFFGFGAILAFFNLIIGIVVLIIGTVMLFVKTGTIIDSQNLKMGRYSSLFGKDNILWTNLSDFDKAQLDFEFISQKMNSRGTSTTSRTKTYTLTLIGDKKKKVFHEYSNYELSKKVLESLKRDFKFEITDKYLQIQKDAYSRRSRRMRKS